MNKNEEVFIERGEIMTTQECAQQILAWIDHTKQSTDRLSAPHYIVDCFSSFIGDLETLCKEQLQEEIPMHPNESITENTAPDVSALSSLIYAAIKEARNVADKIDRGTGGREIALCITKLEEANHRAVDAQMLLGGK